MSYALLIARLLLSAVFGVAGAAKLADQAGSRQALIAFGVPNVLANPLGVVLPAIELVVAASLLPIASAWFGAIAALSILSLFILGMTFNLAQGRTPECNCFGQAHSAPISWSTVARNAVLATVAGFVVWSGNDAVGPSIVGWLDDLTVAQRAESLIGLAFLVLLGAEVTLLLQVLCQQGRLLTRLDAVEASLADRVPNTVASASSRTSAGLLVGLRAPSFRLSALDGRIVTLETLRSGGRSVLLLFTNPSCGPCGALLPEIGRWQQELGAALTIVLVSEGAAEDNRANNAHQAGPVLLQQKREVAEAYQAWGTPAAVLVLADGTIGSPVAQGADAIRTLVSQSLRQAPLKIGELAPSLELRDLSGKIIGLRDVLGGRVLVLFWNPRCGFCQQMLNDLREWEAGPPPEAPVLVVVSTGTIEENRAMGLRSQVLIDDGFNAATAFGANGTPTGVLIDATGKIASKVTAGAQAVLALANALPLQMTEPSLSLVHATTSEVRATMSG